MIKLLQGNCFEVLKTLDENSIDAIVTDPPYGIKFMGKKWDYQIPSVEVFKEMLRVLKPGGHILCACGTNTQHRMACNIEDAGFEIRNIVSDFFSSHDAFGALWDSFTDEQKKLYGAIHFDNIVTWLYGSGFPKSLNVGKAVDKLQGNEREVVGERSVPDQRGGGISSERTSERGGVPTRITQDTKGNSPFEGWGTALKPAQEFFTMARKPLSEKTVAENVLKWGTGAINIDGCRVEGENPSIKRRESARKSGKFGRVNSEIFKAGKDVDESLRNYLNKQGEELGRFPANVIHDGSEEIVALFPDVKSGTILPTHKKTVPKYGSNGIYNKSKTVPYDKYIKGSEGSASRFFYCAKASKSERNKGLEGFEEKLGGAMSGKEYRKDRPQNQTMRANNHPTVKPIKLMSYLCNLITPVGGTILDPYMGSGSTGVAAKKEKFNFVGIELNEEYYKIAEARINNSYLE
jgi:DNA modification methylase